MGEIKSVKVDNWGVFFLQKLQNFFNKTDYCDLTLQFRDNSQLKVHRLVLSACTDYFNVLEQRCEIVDDAIIMPNGLQADVVVPIVNFMYTGTLEFELKMYNRLLKTAKDMNMTVLLKLLEAHRRTMEMHPQKNQAPTSPKMRRKIVTSHTTGAAASNAAGRSLLQGQQQRRVVGGENVPQRNMQPGMFSRVTSSSTPSTSLTPIKQQIGSTTFTRIKQEPEQDENISAGGYTLIKKTTQQQQQTVTSPFEQLRKGYNNNKRPAATSFISPPAKKPNLEDVKEFAEQQRMRKQIAAEFGDDGDYDAGIMDDDTIHNDDDDDDMTSGGISAPPSSASAGVQTTQQQSEDPPGTTTIIVKHEGPDKPPTIVVKDSSNSKMNHSKIISEVLRQYPHLVSSNKNIKLKIMPNAGGQTQKIIVKKEPAESEKPASTPSVASTIGQRLPTIQRLEESKIQQTPSSITTNQPKPQIVPSGNISTNKAEATSQAASSPSPVVPQKRRIDSKTMHALIALGAENTTGPWLCLRCGRNGHPISIPSYRGFRRHLINTHKEIIDPALCEHCGLRSSGKRALHFHMQLEHKVRTNLYIFPECQLCHQMCIDSDALNQHLIDSHPDENKQQCIYCNKIFPEELQLYTHMKTFHKKQALEDGIIDYSDDENGNNDLVYPPPLEEHEMDEEHVSQQQEQKKIKILSDISLPIASSIIKTDTLVSPTEHGTATGESTTSTVSEEYLQEQQEHVETKFVAADGSEVILTDEQRKELLSQLNQENDGSGVVMVLNENQHYTGGETQSEIGAISHDETSQATTATNDEHEEHDDAHIYNELKSDTQHDTEDEDIISNCEQEPAAVGNKPDEEEMEPEVKHEKDESVRHAAALDESKESTDNLEWAENLISEHDMADEMSETTGETSIGQEKIIKDEDPKDNDGDRSQDDISNKLKEIAGDWSEDDDDDDEELDEDISQKPEQSKDISKGEIKNDHEKEETTEDHEMTEAETHLAAIENQSESIQDEKCTLECNEPDLIEETQESDIEMKTTCEDEKEKSVVEDDVDLALMSLHKECDEVEEIITENKKEEETVETLTADELPVSPTDIKEELRIAEDTTTEMNVVEEHAEKIKDEEEEKVENLTEECEDSKPTEVDDTNKVLIDMLLSEHAEAETKQKNETADEPRTITAEDSNVGSEQIIESPVVLDTEEAIQTPDTNQEDYESSARNSPTHEQQPEIEFLDTAQEKIETRKEEVPADATESSAELAAPANDGVTSEEHVKNLISEWGDDEDEDENEDANLKANL